MFTDWALNLVEKYGFRIFPLHGINKQGHCTCSNGSDCSHPGKHPRILDFPANATTDSDVIRAWGSKWPSSNVGILCGNGLLVIDIDDADSAIAQKLLPLLPATLGVKSGREGGLHRYYRVPVDIKLTSRIMGGIDIRHTHACAVGPGSLHESGRRYEFIDTEYPIADLPVAVYAVLVAEGKKSIKRDESGGLIPRGQRHDFLRKEVYRRVLSGKMNEEEVVAVAEKVLLSQVEAPEEIGQGELEGLIRGAFRRKSDFRTGDLTESGLGDMFVQYYQEDVIFLEKGEWLKQDSGIWVPCPAPEALFKPVRELVYRANIEAEKLKEEPDTKYINGFYERSGAWRFSESVIKFARPALLRKVNDFTPPEDTLPFQNGLFDMVSGSFRAFRPEDNIVATMNCAYDPGAKAPKWEQTIAKVTGGDPAIIRYHQQVFGYLCSTRTMRGVFFLVGVKSSGKTTLISTLADILGDRHAGTAQLGLIHHTRSFSEDEDMARTAVALVGKRFVFMDETKKDAIIDPAKFKRIASRDAVLTARHLKHDAFSFINKAKVVILANNQPNIDAEDDAAWDRVMYLPFLISISAAERREGFKDELRSEAAGIMNWCIKGFQDYEANGFLQPLAVAEQIADWQSEENPIAQFVTEACILGAGAFMKATDLWEKYELWRSGAGYGKDEGRMKSAALFSRALVRVLDGKVVNQKTNGSRVLVGIALKG